VSRTCWISGLVLIWFSVATITVGTHFQIQSPRFAEFERRTTDQHAGTGDEERLNPAGRMALVLSFTWQFACCFSGFFALLFTAGSLGIRAIGRWHRELGLLAAGAFGLGCLAGTTLGVGAAVKNFHWGFVTLAAGYLLSAAGLGVGGLGSVWSLFSIASNAKPYAVGDSLRSR